MPNASNCSHQESADITDIKNVIQHMNPWDTTRIAVELSAKIVYHSELIKEMSELLKALYV